MAAETEQINILVRIKQLGKATWGDLTKGMGDVERATERLRKRNDDLTKSNREYADSARQRAAADESLTDASRKRVEANARELGDINRRANLNNQDVNSLRRRSEAVRNDTEEILSSSRAHEHHTRSVDRDSNAVGRFGNVTRRAGRGIGDFRQELDDNNRSAEKLERRLSRLGRATRGLGVASVIIFAKSLTSSLAAVGGEAIALAGSLAQAAGALGGIFVGAIAQAIPMIGIFAGVMQRLSVIQNAVQQASLIQKQGSRTDLTQMNAQRQAAESLITAQEGLTDAQRNLTEARRNAKRELQDLILEEQRSVLSVREAQGALSDALQTGNVDTIQNARLDLREAQLKASRSRQDVANARVGGPGSPQDRVIAAQRQLADATRALADAHIAAAQAADKQSAAESSLAFVESQLSPAERRLEQTIIQFQNQARKLISPITDSIINSFTFAINRVRRLITNPQILAGFRGLSQKIGGLIRGITSDLTNNRSMRFWSLMLREARHNLGPVEKIIHNIWVVFRNIATAAAPVLRTFLKLIANETERWAKASGNIGGMTEFFKAGLQHLRAWYRLFKSIVGLFLTLMGISGPSTLKQLNSLTKTINNARDALEGDPDAKNFFEKSSESISYLGEVLVALGKALADSLDPEAVKAMSDVLKNALIPGLALGIKFIGIFAEILDKLIDNPIGSFILKWSVAILIFKGSLGLLWGIVGTVLEPLDSVFDILGQRRDWWKNSDSGIKKIGIALKRLASGGVSLATKGIGAAADYVGGFLGRIKSSRIGTRLSAILRRSMTRVGAIVGAATSMASTIAQTMITGLATRFRKLVPFFKRWGGRFGIALGLGLITFGLADAQVRDQAKNAFIKLVAIFADAWEAFLNMVVDAINATVGQIPGMPDLGGFDWRQGMEYRLASNPNDPMAKQFWQAGVIMKGEAGIGQGNAPDLSPRERQQRIQQNKEQMLREQARGGPGISPAVQREAQRRLADLGDQTDKTNKKQKDLGDTMRKNRKQADDLGDKVGKAARQHKNFGDASKGVTNKLNDQRGGIRKVIRGFGNLFGTLFGVGRQSKRLGDLIGNVTNKVLKAFGVQKLSFGIPGLGGLLQSIGIGDGGAQTGGFMGDPKERKPDDRVIAVAGGEAVLTGHHQAPVNMAMSYANAAGLVPYANLHDMFRRDNRKHQTAPKGFARGGFANNLSRYAGPFSSGQGFVPVDSVANRLGLSASSGRSNHSTMTTSGNVSDHSWGGAVDFSDGSSSPDPPKDRFANFMMQHLGAAIKQLIYRNKIQMGSSQGAYVADHMDHVHLAMYPKWAFNAALVSALLGGAGGQFANMMGGAGGGMGPQIKDIPKLKIKGKRGPLKGMLQGQADQFRKSANKYIRKKTQALMNQMNGSGGGGRVSLPPGSQNWEAINNGTLGFNQLVRLAQDAGMRNPRLMAHIAEAESSGQVDIVNSIGATGLWQIYHHPELNAKYGSMTNAWNNALAARDLAKANPSLSDWAASEGSWGRFRQRGGFIPAFNKGGIVPGPIGQARPVIAHGGEMFLPTHNIKGFQGGGGGTNSTAATPASGGSGGGGSTSTTVADPFRDLASSFDLLRKLPSQIAKLKPKQFKTILDSINELTRDDGVLDDIANDLEAITNIMATRLTRWALQMRSGVVVQVVSNADKAVRALQDLHKTNNNLTDEFEDINKAIKAIRNKIKKTRDKKKKQQLNQALDGLQAKQQQVEDALAQNLQDMLDAQEEAWQAVLDRFDQRMNDIDTFQQILELLGQISGTTDAAGMKANLENKASVLLEERAAIQAQYDQAVSLGDVERSRELYSALLDNQLALLQNTQAIKELDGTVGQVISFSTTPWTQFRQAIMNGMGGLLPQYQAQIPSLQTGGKVISSGLVNLHAGEVVHDEYAGSVEQHYHFNQPMEVADPVAIGAQIAWKWKSNKV